MFNHVMVGSNDLERSKRFYDAVLGVLGAGEPVRNTTHSGHTRLFYRHDGNTFGVSEPINDEGATLANGSTIGFKCNSPEQVREFHDTAIAHGGKSIEDPPVPAQDQPRRRAPCLCARSGWPQALRDSSGSVGPLIEPDCASRLTGRSFDGEDGSHRRADADTGVWSLAFRRSAAQHVDFSAPDGPLTEVFNRRS